MKTSWVEPGQMPLDRGRCQTGRYEGAMKPFPGKRVEEPGRVADEQPAVTRSPRDAMSDRGGTLDPIAARQSSRVDFGDDGRRALGAQPPQPATAEDDPDVQPVARDGRETAVAAVEHQHSGRAQLDFRVDEQPLDRLPVGEPRAERLALLGPFDG